MVWRQRQQDRRWRHKSRVNQRVSELLAQEYKQLLAAEGRQRREAQRQYLQELRAEASRRGRK
jgi:hypothetical protein